MLFFTVIGILVVIYYLVFWILVCLVDCDVLLFFAEVFGVRLRKLQGQVIWITGASSGIGEAMAYEAAKHGGKLILSARRELELIRVKEKCLQENKNLSPSDVHVLPMDVTKTDLHQQLFEKAVTLFGTIDILVNNAGRSQRANWEDIDVSVDRDLFNLNVFGVISLSRLAVKYFEAKGKGHVAVMSSLAGVVGAPFSGSYTGSKHALHGYFEGLRNEKIGSKIRITLLCPGPIVSNLLQHSFTAKANEELKEEHAATSKRMAAARCATLSFVAIVNNLSEAWMGLFPLMPILYIAHEFPNLSKKLIRFVGRQRLQRLRDQRVVVVSEGP